MDDLWAPAAGFMLGVLFFGGLWWTVLKGVSSPRPALWFSISLALRLSLVLAGFYFVGGEEWGNLLLCLLGFIAARPVVTLWSGRKRSLPGQGASHAS